MKWDLLIFCLTILDRHFKITRFKTFLKRLIRLESVNFKKIRSIAKVAGTLVTIGGAMVMTLYKGPIVDIFHGHGRHAAHNSSSSESADQHWVLGTLMLLGSIVGWSGFFILQVIVTLFFLKNT